MAQAQSPNQNKKADMDALLTFAAGKLGLSAEQVQKALRGGDIAALLSQMKPDEAEKLKTLAKNQAVLSQLMRNPAAAEALKKIKSDK